MASASHHFELVPNPDYREEAAFIHPEEGDYLPSISKWANTEISGVRSKVQHSTQKAIQNDPFYRENRVRLDQHLLEARKGYNFDNRTATPDDFKKWQEAVTHKSLKRNARDMQKSPTGSTDDRDIPPMVMEGSTANRQLDRILAQFALQDKAEQTAHQFGPKRVPYDSTVEKSSRNPASPAPSKAVPVRAKPEPALSARVPVAYPSNPPPKTGMGATIKAKVSSLWKGFKKMFS